MSTEVKTWRARRTVFDKLKRWQRAYETRMADGRREVIGRGPTPEASQEAAQRRWNVGEPAADNSAVMYP
jgi:hypothetical protein